MDNKERAVRLMTHYFVTVWTKAGIRWDSDNYGEIETLVECLIDAAAEKMRDEIGETPWRDPKQNPYLLSSDR
jgi:hypothetical protein